MEMGRESSTSSTSTTVTIEAPEERTEQEPKQDEAGKLHKELAEKYFLHRGKGTEQVEVPQNVKSEAANTDETKERPNTIRGNTDETKERPATIRGNPVNATGGHHVGVFDCNNRAQGTGCNIEENTIVSKDSEYVGVFNCGNDSKKPN